MKASTRTATIVALCALVLTCTGCSTQASDCERRGGQWVKTGERTVVVMMPVGKTVVPLTQRQSTYACEL